MRLIIASALVLACSAALAASSAPTDRGGDRVVRRSKPVYGTVVEIIASLKDGDDASSSQPWDSAFDEVLRVERLIDEDDARSPVAKINAAAGNGEPVVVEPELFEILSELSRLAKLTKGAFDITAAVYQDAWKFDVDASPTRDPEAEPVPKKQAIDRARALVGYNDLILDPAARTVRLKTKGARIGVSAVARGYALDRAAAVLEKNGISDFVISAGGDLVVRGQKGDRAWMVGLQDPRASGHFAALPATDSSVITTGDYEQFFFDGGVRYHDVIDPRTGQPATKCRAVTVVAKDALTAEALSRAVFVLGARDGINLIERLKDVHAVVVTSDNKVVMSKGMRDVVQHRPPTDGP
jgi:FAD:protein FMN transferase